MLSLELTTHGMDDSNQALCRPAGVCDDMRQHLQPCAFHWDSRVSGYSAVPGFTTSVTAPLEAFP
ncbi:MAG: hypothetical protein AMXMBFR64_25120 [Myxococcales bacterium]